MCGEQTGIWSVVNRLSSLLSFLFAEVTRLRAIGGQIRKLLKGNFRIEGDTSTIRRPGAEVWQNQSRLETCCMRSYFRMLLFVLLLAAWASHAQTVGPAVDRVVWVGRGNIYNPIAVVGIDFDGKPGDCSGSPLRCRIPVDLGEDWMTKMRVKVENRSPVTMTCVRVRLEIPRVLKESEETAFDVYMGTIGVIPEKALRVSAERVLQVDQQPSIELRSENTEYVTFAHFLREAGGISRRPTTPAQLRIVVYPWDVFFEDGARWLAPSGYVRPDPDKPGTWVSIFSDPKQTPWTANSK